MMIFIRPPAAPLGRPQELRDMTGKHDPLRWSASALA
jgi:hypothetical protein